jgi:hypothetical protein
VIAATGAYAQTKPSENHIRPSYIRVERIDVPGGAEIDTLICDLPNGGGELPLVSVLVDTLGDSDPSNDALRNVWVLTYARPTITQRIVAGFPFMYVRAGSPHRRENSVPSTIFDMSSAGRYTSIKLLRAVVQSEVLDPIGLPVRASSRAYSSNTSDFRNEHVWQALNVMAAANDQDLTGALSEDELHRIQARLLLSTKIFGDLVADSYLTIAFEKDRNTQIQFRQHNWELLRQQSEENGLYFEPLKLGLANVSSANVSNVLVWAERHPPTARPAFSFHSKFLGIDDPYEGDWLEKWKGYTEKWALDESGSRVEPGTPGSRTVEMVPVALYGLDYPTAPLLLLDFRQPFKAKRHEMMRRAADQVVTGILGITAFGNLEYFAAKQTWTFIRRRHGAAVDRSARLRAYSQLRHALFLDESLDPTLRRDLARRIDGLGLNPFEDSIETEAQLARDQYSALRAYAAAPNGLAQKLDRARAREVARQFHSQPALVMIRVASITTLGLYKHNDKMTPELLADLDRQRRFAWHRRFLEEAINSTPQPEVTYNIDQMRRSVDAITQIGQDSEQYRASSQELVRRVLAQTADNTMRQRCVECLQKLASQKPAVQAVVGADAK